jgi:hypothetical protein
MWCQVKSKLSYDWLPVGQSVLVSDLRLGPATNFSFTFLEIFWHLPFFQYGVPSLTRGWVCNLWLLLVFTSALCLGSEYRGTRDHALLSQLWDSPHYGGADSCICYPRNSVAQFNLNLINLHVIIWHMYSYIYTVYVLVFSQSRIVTVDYTLLKVASVTTAFYSL